MLAAIAAGWERRAAEGMNLHGHPEGLSRSRGGLVLSRSAVPGICTTGRSGLPHLCQSGPDTACTCRWLHEAATDAAWRPTREDTTRTICVGHVHPNRVGKDGRGGWGGEASAHIAQAKLVGHVVQGSPFAGCGELAQPLPGYADAAD